MKTKRLPKRGHFHSSLTVVMKDGSTKISTNLQYNEETITSYDMGDPWKVQRADVALVKRWIRASKPEDHFIP